MRHAPCAPAIITKFSWRQVYVMSSPPYSHTFLPLPITPTLSSPLHQITLDIIKFDLSGKVALDESGLPLTPTLASPPSTPFKSTTLFKDNVCIDSPIFSSPPVTPLLKYHGGLNLTPDVDYTSLPSTPTLPSPPFTPMIKNNPHNNITPLFDNKATLPPTPTFCSPPYTTILQDVEKGSMENAPLPSLPETPTLPSPTFTPLILTYTDGTPPPFDTLPLPETPSFASPPFTPALCNNIKRPYACTPLSTPTMESPLQTPGFALYTPTSPYDPPANPLSPSELDQEQDIWKQ